MPAEGARKWGKKKIKTPGGDVWFPVVVEISWLDPTERYQEYLQTIDNSHESDRDVRVAWVGDTGSTNATETPDDPSADPPGDCISVQRIDKYRNLDKPDRAQETFPELDNKTYNKDGSKDDKIPFFTTHEKTHIVTIYADPTFGTVDDGANITDTVSGGASIDTEWIDEIIYIGERGQEFHYTLTQNPADDIEANHILDDDTIQDVTDSGSEEEPTGVDPPWRIDPFQNIVKVTGAADFILGGYNYDVGNSSAEPSSGTVPADIFIINKTTGEIKVFGPKFNEFGSMALCIDAARDPVVDVPQTNINQDNKLTNRYVNKDSDGNPEISFTIPYSPTTFVATFMCLDLSGNSYLYDGATLTAKDKKGEDIGIPRHESLFSHNAPTFYAAANSSLFIGSQKEVRRISLVDEELDWTVSVSADVGGLKIVGGNIYVWMGKADEFNALSTGPNIPITVLKSSTGEEVRSFTVSTPPQKATNPSNPPPIGFAVDGSGNVLFLTTEYRQVQILQPPSPEADVITKVYLTSFKGKDGTEQWQKVFLQPYAPRKFEPNSIPGNGGLFNVSPAFLGAQANMVVVEITWTIPPFGFWNPTEIIVATYYQDGFLAGTFPSDPNDLVFVDGEFITTAQAFTNDVNAGLYTGHPYFYYSARLFPVGSLQPTMGSLSCFCTGYDAKTGEEKFSITGTAADWNGSPTQAPTSSPPAPLTGSLPFIPSAFGDGPNSRYNLPFFR